MTSVESAAAVIERHQQREGRVVCECGAVWSPRHVAQMLSTAGMLGVTL